MAVEVQTSARVKGEKGDLDADVGSRMSTVESLSKANDGWRMGAKAVSYLSKLELMSMLSERV